MITPRVQQLILILLDQNNPISVNALAAEIGVSKRTVQRELGYIEYYLAKQKLTLRSKTGVGVWIEESEGRERLKNQLLDSQEDDYSDRLVRQKRLQYELLKSRTPKKIYYYANTLGVSETTVSKDLEQVQKKLDSYCIEIIKKPGFGVCLEGKETDFREAIHDYFVENIDTPLLTALFEREDGSEKNILDYKNIKREYQVLDGEILNRVITCFSSLKDTYFGELTQDSYIKLVIHATIALERIQSNELIEGKCLENEISMGDDNYKLAVLTVESLEKEFEIEIPVVEITYIYWHLKGAKLQKPKTETDLSKALNTLSMEEVARELIVAFDEGTASLFLADEEFVSGLVSHLSPTIVRLQHHMTIENQHLDEIKTTYPDVYEKCLRVGKCLQAITGKVVPETEVGLLAIHFSAALVKREVIREARRTVDIGVICASGIGISRLMVSKLEKLLKSRARFTTYGANDLNEFTISSMDFFVSTIPAHREGVDIIYSTPLLSERDLSSIEEKVSYYECTPKKEESDKKFSNQLEVINKVTANIKEMIAEFRCIYVHQDASFKELVIMASEEITPYLARQKDICQRIQDREEIATQIIQELGIGLLHSITIGVTRPSFYVVKPRSGEFFSDIYMRQAKACVVLLLPDDEYKLQNRELLGYISEKLVDQEVFLNAIWREGTEEIRVILEKILKAYFLKFIENL